MRITMILIRVESKYMDFRSSGNRFLATNHIGFYFQQLWDGPMGGRLVGTCDWQDSSCGRFLWP